MTTIMDRTQGSGEAVPLATDDEGYLDFVEGVRLFTHQTVTPVVQEVAGPILDASLQTTEIDELVATAGALPIIQLRDRLARTSQEMFFRGAMEGYRRRRGELLADIEASEHHGPGDLSFELDNLPDYMRRADIHIQPGSYDEDPLAGYVYHYITNLFFVGRNNHNELHQALVDGSCASVEAPRRVLDLGASAGQSATALKTRYPDAEVHSIDIAAPMLRYAHKRAAGMGLDIHFHHMAAEDLSSFEDGSFDLVYAFILFHEVPVDVARKIVSEARRVLRPGGTFVVLDFGANSRDSDVSSPVRRYIGWFDSVHNGEPFAPGFVASNFEAELAKHFADVDPHANVTLPLPLQTRIAQA
jgi:ubiquinone/menaquinone biosynthesis C-methylase UbiE